MSFNNSTSLETRMPVGLLDAHVESFVNYLRTRGYSKRSLRKRRRVADSFTRWSRDKQLAIVDLDEGHIATFLKRSPPQNSKERFVREQAALRLFIRYLRDTGEVPPPRAAADSSPVDEFKQSYTDYLRKERGLAERSIGVYLPLIDDFLTNVMDQSDSKLLKILDATTVYNFLLDRVHDLSSEYTRLLATALRGFLRFAYLRGETATDLSLSVPTVRKWRQATVHPYFSPEEVERVLSAPDPSTERGRRDHAILLLLARLGLRAGEVVALELDDIRWRTGEFVVRGKGRILNSLPLPSDVGEAITLYLRKDRGKSTSRQVFLRVNAPRVGFSGPAAVGHIVRHALAQVGLHAPSGNAAHIFRHSLATRMIRQGASIPEISEVLRHRSQNTTAIYAKVAFEALRSVARPWPGTGAGGAQ